ncbi:MAG: bifunctional nuclease family protein [Candidatus Hydrogenedentes bacterium]|nr:bifunctional nuclease family protein [Candidatus Hydrogenedentota bacterium]
MLEARVLAVTMSPNTRDTAVVLLQSDNKILPILIGTSEGYSIELALKGEKPLRPLSHDLICNILAGLRARLNYIVIYKLENETFFAHMNIEQRNAEGQVEQILKIDARPSDSIAVALRVGCPIFVDEEVMEIAGREIEIRVGGEEESQEEHYQDLDEDFDEEEDEGDK